MKLKSLILGSIAAAGLSTAGFAADLGVLTSLDVCDALGLSGLTISSDTNCLQISGGVNYEFAWGDYRNNAGGLQVITRVPFGETPDFIESGTGTPGVAGDFGDGDLDWQSKVEAWITAVATSDSDFGPAKATITLKYKTIPRYRNEVYNDDDGETDENGVVRPAYFDEAYVAIGDTTVIMAGKRKFGASGSVANLGDDNSYNFLGSFIEGGVDGGGVLVDGDDKRFGGTVIQVVTDLGNGVSAGVGLENLNPEKTSSATQGTPAPYAGTLVGVLQYAGEGVTAHVTGFAGGVLDGNVETWGVHAGATGTFDAFKIRAALAYAHTDNLLGVDIDRDAFHALVSGSATFDIFTVALTGEYATDEVDGGLRDEGYGIGGSIGATVTEGVAINLGARYFNGDNDLTGVPLVPGGFDNEEDALQIAAQLVASVTETIKITGEVGAFWNDSRGDATGDDDLTDGTYYGAAELAWAPGGGFSTSIKGELTSQGAYRATYKASKSFE
ncbi:hypothetical protein [uncultured Devosia sp.]|uniref:hypothetical protein n=1 Tax=uncultured Devosia sp. TaxID=211434 RepID=UPI0035C94F9C